MLLVIKTILYFYFSLEFGTLLRNCNLTKLFRLTNFIKKVIGNEK